MMTNRPSPLISSLLILAMLGYAAFFSTQLFLHYYSFGSRSLDLGNMNQAIWNTVHGRPFHQTNQPGATNRLSLHVEPILLPVSLLYLVYSGPEILFLFQSIVVALGAIPVFALARFKLHSDGLALVFALVYLMFPAIQGATLLDFHAVTLAPPFLLAAFYALETRRPGLFALAAILTAACKEDMTLLVMMLGFYALFINRQYRLGLITIGLCAAWAFVAVFIIPPAFAGTENIHWGRYGHLGSSPLNIVLNFFLQPQLVLSHLQEVKALDYLRLLLTPTAFTALLNPVTLLLALPSLGINLLSSFSPMQRVNSLIYAAPVVPAVLISSIYGVANLQRIVEWANERMAKGRGTSVTHHAPRTTLLFNSLIGIIILAASLGYHFFYGYFPGGGQFRGWEEVTEHHRRAERIFAEIPPEAALSAHDRLNPHVSQRQILYIFDRIEDADHIVLDVTEDSWPLHPVELRYKVDQFLEGDFGVVDAFDGYLLLAKDRPDLPKELPNAFFDFARVPNPASFQPQFPAAVTFDKKLKLLGYDLSYGAHEERLPVVTLYWQPLEPLEQNYQLWPFFIDRQGKLIEDTSERPLVTLLWYPTSHWSPGEIILTRTLPWALGDEFTLAVGVVEGTRSERGGEEAKTGGGWADPKQRLEITKADENLYLFENKTWARLGAFQRTGRDNYTLVAPAATQPAQARQIEFWQLIQLQGVDLPTSPLHPGDSLPFSLYWQSTAPLTVNLTCFAHLLDQNGQVVAQLDWTPQDSLGYLPTTAWQSSRPVVDRQNLALPAELAPGEYRLVVGWYYPITGDRLPVTVGGGGDTVEVGVVAVR